MCMVTDVRPHVCEALQFLCLTPLTVNVVLSLNILSCVGSGVQRQRLGTSPKCAGQGDSQVSKTLFINKNPIMGNALNINNCITVYFLSLENLLQHILNSTIKIVTYSMPVQMQTKCSFYITDA